MNKIITAIALCALSVGLSVKSVKGATINVLGSSITNYSAIGASNQTIGQFTTDVVDDSLNFGAMTFHVNTTNLISAISIVDHNGNLFAILDGNHPDQSDSSVSSSFTFILPPSYPLGFHTYELRGTLSSTFTNGETFSISITPAYDFQSGQTDSTGDRVTATPATVISLGTVVALGNKPNESYVDVVSPAQGDVVNADTNNTITVVIYSPTATNLFVELNDRFISGWFQDFPAGLSTNVYDLPYPYDYAGKQFSITVLAVGKPTDQGGGIIIRSFIVAAKSGNFTINAPTIPRIPVVTTILADYVMRAGQLAHISCQWTNVSVGDPCTIVLDWASGYYAVQDKTNTYQTPAHGPSNVRIPVGTFPTVSGSTNLTITIPANIELGSYYVNALDTAYNIGYNSGPLTHIGLPYAPTNAVIDKLYLSQPSWTTGYALLLMEGLPDVNYDVEESTNNVNWATVNTSPLSDPSGSFYFKREFTNVVNRFYRMKQNF